MEQPSNVGGWRPSAGDTFEAVRTPKLFNLSPTAQEFVPKSGIRQQQQQQQPNAYQGYQQQMDMHQPQSSLVNHRFAAAQGSVEPGGGGGGGGFDYQQQQMGHHLGGNNGAMANGSNDPCKISSLQNRLSNVRISGAGGGGGSNNGKDFNHHQHHQQPMQPHHLQQHRVQQQQQQQPYQQHQGHHGHNHHQPPHAQQLHQPYPYGVGYSNAINNQLNHPILGAANHHLGGGGGGGGMGDNRKHNNGGGGGQQHHHRSRQQQHQHQHHHQQHHHQGSHHHQGGGGGGGGGGHGMMGGGGMGPMAGGGVANVAAGGDYNDDEQSFDVQSFALDYLTEVIAELYDNPGMFEEVKQKLSTMFADFRDDNYVLSMAVEMIFEQSIKESNFRYMGARLCQLLDSLDDRLESLMRQLLRLKMEDQQNELPNYMKQEQVKVRGTTLFLAELYMQLRSPHHKLGEDIARHIINAIDILLNKEGPENIKCVCQCLKLCGFELEQDCSADVNRILEKLVAISRSIQSSVSNLIKSVLDLHKKSWGRSDELAMPVAPVPAMPNVMGVSTVLAMGGVGAHEYNDSPVFYGPDGKILTEEENSFLETNMVNKQNPAYNGYDDDDDVFALIDETDPEVRLAFKDFVQSSNASNRPPHQH